jgi:hypothetical protein
MFIIKFEETTMRKTVASFVTSVKHNYPGQPAFTTEIFRNPTVKEIDDCAPKLGDYVRFIIFPHTEDIYCFDGELLHEYAFEYIRRFREDHILGGGIKASGGKLKYPDLSDERIHTPRYMFNFGEETWLHRWLLYDPNHS